LTNIQILYKYAIGFRNTVSKFNEEFGDKITIQIVDNSHGKLREQSVTFDKLRESRYTLSEEGLEIVKRRLIDATLELHQQGKLSDEMVEGLLEEEAGLALRQRRADLGEVKPPSEARPPREASRAVPLIEGGKNGQNYIREANIGTEEANQWKNLQRQITEERSNILAKEAIVLEKKRVPSEEISERKKARGLRRREGERRGVEEVPPKLPEEEAREEVTPPGIPAEGEITFL